MSPAEVPYRDFTYPLNVFMHVLTREEGRVDYLHYGLFEREGESIADAQEHSTDLVVQRLPPPPARVLEVGIGLGTTLARLTQLGYEASGITPDVQQIEAARQRYGDTLDIVCTAFEQMEPRPFDAILFQESSQYIDSAALFAKAREIAPYVVVIDEFAAEKVEDPGALHDLPSFLAEAADSGFDVVENIDLSSRAAPTMSYFESRLSRHRDALIRELDLTAEQIDELIASGERYRNLYARGIYEYRLIRFERRP